MPTTSETHARGKTRRVAITLLAAVSTSVILAGCSSSTASDTESADAESSALFSQELHDRLPESILSAGVIKNINQQPNPPWAEVEDTTTTEVTGINTDIFAALEEVLGVDIETEYVTDFAQLIPSVETDRVDMAFQGLYDNVERQDVVILVDYMLTGMEFLVPADSDYTELSDLCGETIATPNASSHMDMVLAMNDELCVSQGLEPMEAYQAGLNQEYRDVMQGRAAAVFGGREQGRRQNEILGEPLTPLGEPMNFNHAAAAINLDNMEFAEVIRDALNVLIDEGVMEEILDSYGLADSMIPEATINAGPPAQ